MTEKIKRVILPDLPRGGPYSQVVVHGNTAYLSGVVGMVQGEETSFSEQWNVITQRAAKIMSSVGSDLASKSLKVTVYLSDPSYSGELNDAYKSTFGEDAPARTTIVCEFTKPEVKVEIDIIASVD